MGPQDNRRSNDTRLTRIEEQLDHLSNQQSFKKNGESWPQWFGRFFTIQNVLLAIVIVFEFGGTIQKVTTKVELVDGLVEREQGVLDQQREMGEQILQLRELTSGLSDTSNTLMTNTARLAQTTRALTDRMNRTPTRAELNELRNAVLPSLQRIERAGER